MAATSIANPQMPLLTPIPGGFMHGKIVRIQGSLSPSAQRFAINLQCGPNTNPRDDLALHVNARIHERAVVRNSLVSGQWGPEERHGPTFPFVPGQGFEILILAESNNYKIAINGQHFAEFRSRTPMERVSYLSADGEIMISKINFEGGSHGMPGMHAPMPAPMPMPMPGMPQQHYPAPGMPHQPYPAPGGMYPTQPGMGYPTQPGMGYPTQPGMGYPTQPGMGYPTQPGMHPANYGHLSPKSAPYPDPYAPNPDPYAQYPNQPAHGGSAGSGSGLSGLINKASTAVAGLGLASGVTGILGSLAGGGVSLNEPRLKPCMTTSSPIRFYLRFFRFFNFTFRYHHNFLLGRQWPICFCFLFSKSLHFVYFLSCDICEGVPHCLLVFCRPASQQWLSRCRLSYGLSGSTTGIHESRKWRGRPSRWSWYRNGCGCFGNCFAQSRKRLNIVAYVCGVTTERKKAAKKQHKAQKKAMKYGIPLAAVGAVGVGAYGLHHGMKHHGYHGRSSSSSSSSSE